ncbi:MAG: hypothetical protein Q9187_007477 [Circinaria calcarea]
MQDVFQYPFQKDKFRYYQPQPPRQAPTAHMLDPNLETQETPQANDETFAENTMDPDVQKETPKSEAGEPSRVLPSTAITANNVDEAYVQFIFYCNPNIPLSTDTSELRRGFRSPPKTDGKIFDTFVLFGLIKRLEAKEIETWSQLVIELGVEPPDPVKNQSTQKVQQFARWLHAFHIDAFFQYCLGKQNTYFLDITSPDQSLADLVRDGVSSEEDLAIRALLPEWRPKRGRRKTDHSEANDDSPAKRIQRARSATAEASAPIQTGYSTYPQSAFPWGPGSDHESAWAAAQRAVTPNSSTQSQMFGTQGTSVAYPGQQGFWGDGTQNTPATPYPQSAVTPRINHNNFSQGDTPQSAHPQTSSPSFRGRKRHGPAVSAAWPITGGGASTGKLRGRPPSDRSVQNGPFSTFPVNPTSKNGLPKNNTVAQPPASETAGSNPEAEKATQAIATPGPPRGVGTPLVTRPSKLQLQVPQHEGGPVRLATPPPKVLLNGEDNGLEVRPSSYHVRRTSADFFNTIDEEADDDGNDDYTEADGIDWKRRAFLLKRKLEEKEEELKALRRRVLEAVM